MQLLQDIEKHIKTKNGPGNDPETDINNEMAKKLCDNSPHFQMIPIYGYEFSDSTNDLVENPKGFSEGDSFSAAGLIEAGGVESAIDQLFSDYFQEKSSFVLNFSFINCSELSAEQLKKFLWAATRADSDGHIFLNPSKITLNEELAEMMTSLWELNELLVEVKTQ